jgi:transcriptional regulator with XRE-family HTH domain
MEPQHRDSQRRARPVLRMHIGEALRRNRLAQRRTLADVARAARVSVPYLSEVERGRKEASSEVLAAVCDALEIELSDVLAEVEEVLRAPAPVVGLASRMRAPVATPPRISPPHLSPPLISPPVGRRSGDVLLLAA